MRVCRACVGTTVHVYNYYNLSLPKGVAVPNTHIPVSEEDYQQLQELIDPLAESDSYGIDLYQETLPFCRSVFNLETLVTELLMLYNCFLLYNVIRNLH